MNHKESYLQISAQQLKEWDAEIVKLKAKADKADTHAKFRLFEHIDELHGRLGTAREKLKQLDAAGDGAWEDLKAGVDKSWYDLRGAFIVASLRFR